MDNELYLERITPEEITILKPFEIFVFGSNESGFHGAGAAHTAYTKFGAKYGLGFGHSGMTFAIPTKSFYIRGVLSLEDIGFYVKRFIHFAKINPKLKFYVTQIGCGIAGYTPEEIAPLFKEGVRYKNIYLPETFWKVLNHDTARQIQEHGRID